MSFKFAFGSLAPDDLWAEGDGPLERARPGVLRSIAQECRSNEEGAWWAEYVYVVQQSSDVDSFGGKWQFRLSNGDPDVPVKERCDNKATSEAVRDEGHGGMVLADFHTMAEAKAAKLSLAEVAMLRLYTGPLFRPLNGALRSGDVLKIQPWWTCISVLVCAVYKLSLGGCSSSTPRYVYRGLWADSLGADACVDGLDFAKDGGVELAFCSTTTDRSVAERYSGGKIVMGFELSSTTRAASMQWLSQFPAESEWLLPPFTALKPKSSSAPAAGGKATELIFVATVRVPFRELNLRATLHDPPTLPRRNILTLSRTDDYSAVSRREDNDSMMSRREDNGSIQGDGRGRFHSGADDRRPELERSHMEKALTAGRVDAGIAALQRGFFGGCGMWAIFVYLGFSGFPGSLAIAFWTDVPDNLSATSNGPISAFVMGLMCVGMTLAMLARALVLVMANYHWGALCKVRGEGAALQAQDALQVQGDGSDEEGDQGPGICSSCGKPGETGVDFCVNCGSKTPTAQGPPPSNPATSKLDSELETGTNGSGKEDSGSRLSALEKSVQGRGIRVGSRPEDAAKWERRAVDSLPQMFSAVALCFFGCAVDQFVVVIYLYKKGLSISPMMSPTKGNIPASALVIAWLVATVVPRTVASAIVAGRKRSAQDIFSAFFILVGFAFAYSNLPTALGIESSGSVSSGQAWLRGVGGLVGMLFFASGFYTRRVADKEAEDMLKEDAQRYAQILEHIRSGGGSDLLNSIRTRCADANEAALESGRRGGMCCFRRSTEPLQNNPLRIKRTMYSGKYLSHLFALAQAWSGEFRQIMTKLAVLSGCRLEIPSGREFDGIKDPARAIEKVCRVYGGRCDRVLDLLRATVVADDLAQMLKTLDLLTDKSLKFDNRVSVKRIKNKFDMKVKGGFRNIHINLTLMQPGAAPVTGFVCELQIQHREIFEAETHTGERGSETPHDRYIAFRKFVTPPPLPFFKLRDTVCWHWH